MKKNLTKVLCSMLAMALLLSCALLPVAAADSEAAPTIGNCENLAPDTLTGSLEFKSGAEVMWLKALDQVSGNTWYIQQTVNFTGSRNMESLDINIAASGELNSGKESMVRVRLVPEQNVWQIVTATGAIYTPANTVLANGTLASAVELNRDYIVTVRVVDGDKMSLWVDGKQLAIDVALSEAGLTDLVPAWGWRVYGPTGTISNIQVWDGVTTKCPTIGNCENLAPAALAGSLEFKSGAEIKWLEALDQVSGNTWYVQQTVNYTTLNAGQPTDIAIAASGTINSGSETIVRVQLYAGAKRWGIAAVKGAIYTWTDPLANGSGSIESEIETGKDYVITVQAVDGDKVSIWLDGKLLIRNFSLADAGYTDLKPVWGYRAYSQTGTISNIQVWDGVTTKCPTIGNYKNLVPASLAGGETIVSDNKTVDLAAASGNNWYSSQKIKFSSQPGSQFYIFGVGTGMHNGTREFIRFAWQTLSDNCYIEGGHAAMSSTITWGDTVYASGKTGYTLTNDTEYTITTQVIGGDKLTVWINGKRVFSNFSLSERGYTDVQPAWGYRNHCGLAGTISDIQVWDGVTLAPVFTEAVADISAYRTEGAYTAPEKDGYVFAGWFTDEACTTPVTTQTTNVYAKWVTKDVLSVKAQVLAGTTAASESTDLRFLTTVDSLDYQNIGFRITINGKTNTPASTSVYKAITARSDGAVVAKDPTVFSEVSEYFHTYTITKIPSSAFGTGITVTPYWTTLDGTVANGVARTLTVNEIISTIANA